MACRSTEGFRHGLRVRVDGRRGVLLRCERSDGTGSYWKVRLQRTPGAVGPDWVWPDRIVVDGPGDDRVDACGSCGLPFYRRAGSGELLCDRCTAEQFGTAVRATEPMSPRPFGRHLRRRRG